MPNKSIILEDLKSTTLGPWSVFLQNSTDDLIGNITGNFSNGTTQYLRSRGLLVRILPIVLVIFYGIVFVTGLVGNCLVIYVVTMFSKMKTVTNMYIVNLAVADVLFLLSMPFLMITTILGHWTFGYGMCKLYMILVSINYFTGIFTLTVMSADRYMAVCHPVQSVTLRTPKLSFILCVMIWIVSILIMMPTFLYSKTVHSPGRRGETCTISWPSNQLIPGNKAFVWYCFFLSYTIPMSLISFFYLMVIIRLKSVGPANKSKEKKKSHRRVTRMVLTVVGVYMMFWLPYWVFQVTLILRERRRLELWEVLLFNACTVLTFANSMMNPLLYNFLSENFRKSFVKAFTCVSRFEANKSLVVENSMYPRNNQRSDVHCSEQDPGKKYEMSSPPQICTEQVKVDKEIPKEEKVANEKESVQVAAILAFEKNQVNDT